MSLIWREGPDGRRSPGYAVYLAGGLGALAAVWLLHRRPASGVRAPPRGAADRGADVASITQPAALMAPVRVAARTPPARARSYRLDTAREPEASGRDRPAGGGGSFDAVAAALADESSAPGSPYAPLPPSFSPAVAARTGRNPPSEEGERAGLLGYRDAAADVPLAGAQAAREEASPEPEWDLAPRGTLVAVYLLTTVDTGNPAAVIEFAASRSLVLHRRCELAFGTRFLGRLKGRPMRDRLNLAADTILFPDGLELPVSASAVEADEAGSHIRPGIAAVYCPPPAWVRAAPYASDFFTGFLGLLQSRAEAPYGAAGVGMLAPVSASPRGPALQASAQAIQDFTQARLREMEERYASFYLVPAGTACWLQLDADLDLGAAVRPRHPPRGAGRASAQSVSSPTHAPEVPEDFQ